jgi:hypothetical protein
MTVDHVVPVELCNDFKIDATLREDYSNMVLACAACNSFDNQYRPNFTISLPVTDESFFDFRDRVFEDRKQRIVKKHEDERRFYEQKVLPALGSSKNN